MQKFLISFFHRVVRNHGQAVLQYRFALVVGLQLGLIVVANVTAFALRFEGDILPDQVRLFLSGLPFILVIYAASFTAFGIQRGLWRYVGLHDLGRILWAVVISSVVAYGVLYGLLGWIQYPRSIIILTGVFSGLLLAGIRLAVRWFREWLQVLSPTALRVLIVGAGHASELLIRDMHSSDGSLYRPVGLVDDDPIKQKMKIHGVPVVGKIVDIPIFARSLAIHEIIVAISSASSELKQRVLTASEGCKVPIRILPSMQQLLANPERLRQIRPMSLEDLLQREPLEMDRQELHPLLKGKRVLVTGAGGSIGSELCWQVAQYQPASLILFERYENGLYALDLALRMQFPSIRIVSLVGDVSVHDRVIEVFRQTGPEIIFHAAAHKHVPLMELNPKEAVRNNVFGTKTVAEAALACGIDHFVLISTDKAVNPTSVMGATKRVAEDLLQSLSRRGKTKFTVVRFGNVLGSNGSVVPLFTDQIRRGGPVTVTHPEIKRFFMTIPEAVQLVLQASHLGRGGEVFILDMGEQVKVADLAKNMIVLSGLVPDQDIQIVYSGLRPGEKLYEEFFDEAEQVEPTSHIKIRRVISPPEIQSDRLDRAIAALETAVSHGDDAELIRQLKAAVPTYTPASSSSIEPIH